MMNVQQTHSPFYSQSPPERGKAVSSTVEPDRALDLKDAFVKDSGSSLGILTRAGIVALGVVSVAGAATQVQAADLRADSDIGQLEARVTDTLLGNIDVRGAANGTPVSLDLNKDVWGNYDLTGDWAGKKIDLSLNRTLLGNFDLDGKVGGETVHLDINKDVWGNHDVSGNWGGNKVDVSVNRTLTGLNVKGKWGSSDVDYTANRGLLGKFYARGKGPSESFFPWLMSQQIHAEK